MTAGSEPTGTASASGESDTQATEPNCESEPAGDRCFSGIELRLDASTFDEVSYLIEVRDEAGDFFRDCAFKMPEGPTENADCWLGSTDEGTTVNVSMETYEIELDQPLHLTVHRDAAPVFQQLVVPTYQFSENMCTGSVDCVVAELGVDTDMAAAETCTAMGEAFEAATLEVRSCEDASDCGQVLGYSCGCTNDWVGRLDADPTEMNQLAEDGVLLGCDWASFDSDCSCPEADGFTCREDNICDWNLL